MSIFIGHSDRTQLSSEWFMRYVRVLQEWLTVLLRISQSILK